MAIYPKATSELNIFNDDDGDAISPPDFMKTKMKRRIFGKLRDPHSIHGVPSRQSEPAVSNEILENEPKSCLTVA